MGWTIRRPYGYSRTSVIRTSLNRTRRLTERHTPRPLLHNRHVSPVIIAQSTRGSSPASVAMASVISASTRKRKRVVLTISDKLKVCQLVKGEKALQSVAEEYE